MTKTLLSSQIIWLEYRVQELEDQVQYRQNTNIALSAMCEKLKEENKHLYDLNHDQEEKIKQLKDENFKRAHKIINLEVEIAGHKEQIKQSYRDTLAADNFDVELDKEFIDRLREYSDKGKGSYESKSLARRDMIFELAKGVKGSTQDKNMIRLAKAIEHINYKIARE